MEAHGMTEIPIEFLHLREKLRELFTGRLAESTSGTAQARESNFLSRALAAYAIYKLSVCTLDEAVEAVVDGEGDGGIDAIHFAAATNILWVAQSKFFGDGRGEPDLGGVAKFKTGLENLLQGKFEAFGTNDAWQKLTPRLEALLSTGALLQVRVILVYSGINLVSEDRRRLFEDLIRRFSPDSDYLDVKFCSLTTVHDWLIGADQGPGVPEVRITLRKPGWVLQPYETIYGLVPLQELARLYGEHGKRLVIANIRRYKGSTAVNEQIFSTISQEPEHLFYLNNGLTAYCERLEVDNRDRGNAEEKRIRAFGLSIVNGAQTLGCINRHFAELEGPGPDGNVFLKVISLERCADDRAFAERIARGTNFQNQIGARDFVALDDEQERISNQLLLSGITYQYKDDADTPTPDETNFNLEEATSACACLVQMGDCDFCARVLANRRSLWSFEEVYPESDMNRSRYSRVFPTDRSARTVWRSVQTQRVVKQVMQESARASVGTRKAFFENARWLILNVLFLKLHPERGDALSLTLEEVEAIVRFTQESAEQLWRVCESLGLVSRRSDAGAGQEAYEQPRHFRSVFSSAADCQRLRNGLLAKLAEEETRRAPAQEHAEPPAPNTHEHE
jgi:hypothetical protein